MCHLRCYIKDNAESGCDPGSIVVGVILGRQVNSTTSPMDLRLGADMNGQHLPVEL